MQTLAQDWSNVLDAMASFENVNPSYNNPAGLSYGSYAIGQGATGSTASGIAIFPDWTTGSTAAQNLINQYAVKGNSLADMINKWAPPNAPGNSPQSTANYIQHVSGLTGLDPNAPLLSTPGATSTAIAQPTINVPAAAGAPSIPTSGTSSSGTSAAPATPTVSTGSTLFGWFTSDIGRWVAIALGLILIGAGLMMFKPVQETIVTAGKTARAAVA